jgi:hypothetical protein
LEALVKAVADLIAALFRPVGVVGAPRRRDGIRDDLRLLKELESVPEFGRESYPHTMLVHRIQDEIERLTGFDRFGKRVIPWSNIVQWSIFAAALGGGTYLLDRDGFTWYSLLTAIPGALFAIAAWGAWLPDSPDSDESDTKQD